MSDLPKSPYDEPIFLNALGKSASSFLCSALTQGLRIPQVDQVAGGAYPLFLLNQRLVQKAATGNYFANHHLPAHPVNLYLLDHFYKKMIVHIRDPRQATLSHLRNMWRHKRDGDEWLDEVIFLSEGGIPEDCFERSEREQLDTWIDLKLHESVEWIQGWLDVENDPSFRPEMLITTYETFVQDKTAFMHGVLDFYAIAHDTFDYPIEKEPDPDEFLYEKSETSEEWLSVFTDDQKMRANLQVPNEMCERFGWPLSLS
jgi:hypothetical protein